MSGPPGPYSTRQLYEAEIAAIRFRVGLFGRPILQIKRALYLVRLSVDPEEVQERSTGKRTVWRDAKRGDLFDVATYLAGIQSDQSGRMA